MIELCLGMLRTLGRTPEFQAVQAGAASKVFDRSVALAKEYGVESQRGVALMFDIVTQNGSISAAVKSEIHGVGCRSVTARMSGPRSRRR